MKWTASMPPVPGVRCRCVGRAFEGQSDSRALDVAAGLPNAIRRYGRLQICATNLARLGLALVGTILLLFAGTGLAGQQVSTNEAAVRFCAVDVYVDSGAAPLAAYQLEFSVAGGAAKIVGIEGGEHPAFAEPPYYDPTAMQNDKVIIAAFNTAPASQLPRGKTRIATIHLRTTSAAELQYESKLEAAADSNGKRIPAEISVQERQAK